MYTQLKNRKLWYDGVSSYQSTDVQTLLPTTKIEWVDIITPEINAYNKTASYSNQINVKNKLSTIVSKWDDNIQTISYIDVVDYIEHNHTVIVSSMEPDDVLLREQRLDNELMLFSSTPGMWDMLTAVVYIINNLTVNNQVWGVGRGSAVSSYLLYVVGVHDVDSFAYDLDITDFIN